MCVVGGFVIYFTTPLCLPKFTEAYLRKASQQSLFAFSVSEANKEQLGPMKGGKIHETLERGLK